MKKINAILVCFILLSVIVPLMPLSSADPGVVVTTNDATGVQGTNATLNGLLNDDGGSVCTVDFQYGLTTSYGSDTSDQVKTSGQTFSVNQSGFSKGTLYHYRARASAANYKAMIVHQENTNASDEINDGYGGQYYKDALIFNLTTAQYISGCAFYVGPIGSYGLTVIYDLRNTTGSPAVPVSAIWASCSVSFIDHGFLWRRQNFSSPIYLQANTKYALVVRAATSQNMGVRYLNGENYSRGYRCRTNAAGAVWTAYTSTDMGFRLYNYTPSFLSYGSDKTFLMKPDPLTGFTATPYSASQINLAWTSGTGGAGAYLEYAAISPPSSWTKGAGTVIGNVVGSSYSHTGLAGGVRYYYKAWAIANSGGQQSDNSSTKPFGNSPLLANARSLVTPTVTTNNPTGVQLTNATLRATLTSDGGTPSAVDFQYGTTTSYGSTTANQTGKRTGDAFLFNIGGLSKGTWYHYRARAINSYQNITANQETGSLYDAVTIGPPYEMAAQIINLNQTQYIAGVSFFGYRSGSPNPCYYDIRNVSGGLPASDYIARVSFSGGSWGTTDGWHQYNFSSPVLLQASTNYALVVWTSHSNSLYLQYANSNVYPNGYRCHYSSSWAAYAGTDMRFRLYKYAPAYTGYGSDNTFLTKPDPLTGLAASAFTSTQINLTWSNGVGGDGAYIEYATGSAPSPWNVGSGTKLSTTLINDACSSLNNWTTHGTWGLNSWYHSSPYSIATGDITQSNILKLNNQDMSNYTSIIVSWYWSLWNMPGNPSWYIMAEVYDGVTWNAIATKYRNDYPAWDYVSIPLGPNYCKSNFAIRFHVNGDMGGAREMMVDDVMITGSGKSKETPFAHTGLTPGSHYFYKVWPVAYDSAQRSNGSTMKPYGDSPMTANAWTLLSPVVTTNAATGTQGTNSTLQGTLSSDGGQSCTVRFQYGLTTAYGTNTTNQTKSNGQSFSAGISSLLKGTLYHFRAFANNTIGVGYGSDKTFLTKPDAPTVLTATPINTTRINLSWTKGTGANYTYIERNATGKTAWAWGTGVFVYNGTGSSCGSTGLHRNVKYYYQAWSFTRWDALSQFSTLNATKNATTLNILTPTITTNPATNVQETVATLNAYLNDDGFSPCTVSCQYGKTMGYGSTSATQVLTTGGTYTNGGITGLSIGTLYHFKVKAVNSLYTGYGADLMFLTKPLEPTNFNSVSFNGTRIDFTWTPGVNATRTVIERNASGQVSWTRGNGIVVYNGTGSSFSDTGLHWQVHYYYQAWSFTSNSGLSQYSNTYKSTDNTTLFEGIITNNILANPQYQAFGGEVNISCDFTHFYTLFSVKVNISGPGGFNINETMVNIPGTSQYYYTRNYTLLGVFSYYIYAKDILNNVNKSTSHAFSSLGWIHLTNETPSDASHGADVNTVLGVTVSHLFGDLATVDIYYYTNASGITTFLGENISVPAGGRQYSMSSYGIVHSPYDVFVMYPCLNFDVVHKVYQSNPCKGTDIGRITSVVIGVNGSGRVMPIINGRNGSNYTIHSAIDITHDSMAPTEWSWDDIKNLDVFVECGNLTFILVTYDMQYGENTTIYWSANATDGIIWGNKTFFYTTEAISPIITNEHPSDAYVWNYLRPSLSALVREPQGQAMNVSFWVRNDTGDWVQLGSMQHGNNGTFSQEYLNATSYNSEYYWMISASDGSNIVNKTYRFTTRPEQIPVNLTAAPVNGSAINLTWIKDSYTDLTLIKKRSDCYPLFTDPGFIYQGSSNHSMDTGVLPGTLYFYSAWAYNTSDDTWTQNVTITYAFSMPKEPQNFKASVVAYNKINLTWSKTGTAIKELYIYRKTGGYPSSRADPSAVLIYQGNGTQYSDMNNLSGNITYYYRAWSWTNITYNNSNVTYNLSSWSIPAEYHNKTLVGPPTLIPYVTDVTNTTAMLRTYVLGDGGQTSTCGLYWGTTPGQYNITKGTFSTGQWYNQSVGSLTIGSTYYFQPWGSNSHGFSTGPLIRWASSPYAPSAFTATKVNYQNISLSITKGTGADITMVLYKSGSYPVNVTDGSLAYNDSGTSGLVTGLNGNVTYYFRAWSFNVSHGGYSKASKLSSAKTDVGPAIVNKIHPPINIENISCTFRGTITYDDGNPCYGGVSYGTTPSADTNIQWTAGTYVTGQTFSISISNLQAGTKYYYKVMANNGYYITYDDVSWFITRPVKPTNLDSISIGARRIDMTWTKGQGGDKTCIVRKIGSYPTSVTDGTVRYNSTGTSFSDQQWYPLLESTGYYYRAFSWNWTYDFYSRDYSSDYATTSALPTVSNEMPLNMSMNINRLVYFSLIGHGNNPLNISFLDMHDLNRGVEIMPNNATGSGYRTFRLQGWDPAYLPQKVYRTYIQPYGLLSKRGGYGNHINWHVWTDHWGHEYWSYYYVELQHFVTADLSGGLSGNSSKQTIYFDTPKYIGGAYIDQSSGGMYANHGPHGYMGYTQTTVFEYHDYDLNTWVTSTRVGIGWGSQFLYTDNPCRVDMVRVYRHAEAVNKSSSSSFSTWNGRVNYITVIQPTLMAQRTMNSGDTASFTSHLNLLNHTYYWAASINDTRDIGYSHVYNFTTERIFYINPEPIGDINDTSNDHQCNITVYHTGGDSMKISLYYKADNGTWMLGNVYNNVHNGTYTVNYPDSNAFATNFSWKVITNDTLDNYTQLYSFHIRAGKYPLAPAFTLSTGNLTTVYINGIYSNSLADSIIFRYNLTGYPSNPWDSGILLFNSSTISNYTHTDLKPGTRYNYSAFAWNRSDNVWSRRMGSIITRRPGLVRYYTKTLNTTGITLYNISSLFNLQTFATGYTDKILIRYDNQTHGYPSRTSGIFIGNLTYIGINLTINVTGLIYNNTYYFRMWPWNETTRTFGLNINHTGKTNGPPQITTIQPGDGDSVAVPLGNVSSYIRDFNGDYMDVYYRVKNDLNGTWTTFYTWSHTGDGAKKTNIHPFVYQHYLYTWSINVTDSVFWTNKTQSFYTGGLPVIENLSSQVTETQNQMSWTKVNGSDVIYIMRKLGSYPVNRTDGTLVYNASGTSVTDGILTGSTLYYYTIWGHNNASAEYSLDPMYLKILTKPYPPSNIIANPVSINKINISWTKGVGANNTLILFKPDSVPQNSTDGYLLYNASGTLVQNIGLKPYDFYVEYQPASGTNNMGVYPLGGQPFNRSCDGNLSSWWNPDAEHHNKTFSYVLDGTQRVLGIKLLIKDFYNDPHATWDANITKIELKNSGWTTDWTGKEYNTNSQKQWWNYTTSHLYDNITEIRFTGWTDFVTPSVYEAIIGKLGQTYRYTMWSVAVNGGLIELSDPVYIDSHTLDTPFNSRPMISSPFPVNNEPKAEPRLALNVNVSDQQGDPMNVTFQTNYSSGVWHSLGTVRMAHNGTASLTVTFTFSRDIYWRVNVSDGQDVQYSYYYKGTDTNQSPTWKFHTRKGLAESDFTLTPASPTNADTVTFNDLSKNGTRLIWEINYHNSSYHRYSSGTHAPFNFNHKFNISNIYPITLLVENNTDAGLFANTTKSLAVSRNITYLRTPESSINYVAYHLPQTITSLNLAALFQIPTGWWIHHYNSTNKNWESYWVNEITNSFNIRPWDVVVIVGYDQRTVTIPITQYINPHQSKTIPAGLSYLIWTSDRPTTLMNLSIGLTTGDWIHVYDTATNQWNSKWIGYALVGTNIQIKPYTVFAVSVASQRAISIG